ncbi:MAG: DUF3784 domain-containing protein [Flavobacteriales bacterium]|nr:DUF3784 domain-containing protein [Flavobacteriales bacterium]
MKNDSIMIVSIIVLVIVGLILAIMGVTILIGKGDNLIAGYNTASKEEREQYNIKRLRGLIGGLLIVLAPMTILLIGAETITATFSFIILTLLLCIIVVILANTWAKKKAK